MTENDTANPCVLCEIGCKYTEYHNIRHLQDPGKGEAFRNKLLNEPLEVEDFDHPPFDDVDMTADAYEFFDEIVESDDDNNMDYEDPDNITYLDKTI
tara:strand:+ start:314 stop:604 length:291 start_codon:yes stop_codon:yes gene_type:complete